MTKRGAGTLGTVRENGKRCKDGRTDGANHAAACVAPSGKFAATIFGDDGDDTLDALNGLVDHLIGGAGTDTAIVDSKDQLEGVEVVKHSR